MKAIEVCGISKSYKDVKAVDDISFTVERESICAILGPNGSGKTTTIKSICNLIQPDQGEIRILGKKNRKATNHISAVFEGTRNLYWRLTPKENLRYFAGISGLGGKNVDRQIDEILERFNLTQKKNVTVNELSRGMKQKVAIGTTLVCNTEIILLDEPTLGLDVQSFIDIKEQLKELARDMNKTILLSTHDMNLVEGVSDKVIVLNKGKLVAKDSMSNLLEMFKSKTYEIVLKDKVNEEVAKRLSNDKYKIFITENKNVLEVDMHTLNDIFDIVNQFKDNDILIKEIKQKEINFERIYLDLTKGGTIA
ncbi:MAG: ABC transporter ATP-binding protein [Vallitalea sp.]|nr:ABC transporter ATP-binding protein [Vallitalea sp.]